MTPEQRARLQELHREHDEAWAKARAKGWASAQASREADARGVDLQNYAEEITEHVAAGFPDALYVHEEGQVHTLELYVAYYDIEDRTWTGSYGDYDDAYAYDMAEAKALAEPRQAYEAALAYRREEAETLRAEIAELENALEAL